MKLKFALVLGVLAVAFAGVAIGADDPIKERRDIMKKNGAAAKIAVEMIKGTTPYDATAAAAAMKTLEEDLTVFPTLFPEGSDQGQTNASPDIWKNMDDFKAHAAKLVTDATAAEAAAAQGLDSFKTAFDAVGADCGSCHEKYRLKTE
jgi:cytochrome c556